jgi:CRISPR-associated exonuclease Cas4
MAHNITADQENDFLEQGRLNTESHYLREDKEITLPSGVRVDKIRKENGQLVLSEIKKTSKFLPAARLQLAYYLWLLEQDGVYASGEVLVPDERKREVVDLDEVRAELMAAIDAISQLVEEPKPPAATWLHYCKTCAYAEFCWSGTEA